MKASKHDMIDVYYTTCRVYDGVHLYTHTDINSIGGIELERL
jgi:hypothetical protein